MAAGCILGARADSVVVFEKPHGIHTDCPSFATDSQEESCLSSAYDLPCRNLYVDRRYIILCIGYGGRILMYSPTV